MKAVEVVEQEVMAAVTAVVAAVSFPAAGGVRIEAARNR